jgi:hypothetical protein
MRALPAPRCWYRRSMTRAAAASDRPRPDPQALGDDSLPIRGRPPTDAYTRDWRSLPGRTQDRASRRGACSPAGRQLRRETLRRLRSGNEAVSAICPYGLMFWLWWNTFSGSYFLLMA